MAGSHRNDKKEQRSSDKGLVPHKQKADTDILDQFTVSYTRGKKYVYPEYIWNLYVYADRIEIHRNMCFGDGCVRFEIIDFDDLDSIQIQEYGRYMEYELFFLNGYKNGTILLKPKNGTKYSEYATKEYQKKRERPLSPTAIEIWFDMKYNDMVREHNDIIQKIFYDYKTSGRQDKNNRANPYVYFGGDMNIENVTYGDFTVSIDNSIHKTAQRVMNEVSGDEREAMLNTLVEVEKLVKEMQKTGKISEERKSSIEKAGEHFKNHSWFYGPIITILGNAALKYIFGA